jgi:dihydrodipicolinate synthase/N-acetylneuraminate lyase
VGVHTTQFAIHEPQVGLYRPVLELATETIRSTERHIVKVAGLVGHTPQAMREAELARSLGYDCGLLSLAAFRQASEEEILAHCRTVAQVMPLFGFYLQPAVGGRILSYAFWRRFVEIEPVVAIKVAPFNRYQTLDVVRALADSGRTQEIVLYTGNDDHIVEDLLTPYRFHVGEGWVSLRIVGGLLGHWAVWTRKAVELLADCQATWGKGQVPAELLTIATQVTDANAALFDAANGFAGCIAGIHEVLRRQGLLAGRWCLDPHEDLSPGQAEEIDRVCAAYPRLKDDAFVAEHLDAWLA